MRVPLSFSREAASPEKGRFRKNSCLPQQAVRGHEEGAELLFSANTKATESREQLSTA